MSKHTNPVQKVWIFFENRKVLKLFRFSYKITKTANPKIAITSNNTWIWRLKFGLRVQNESYSILFTHFFDFKRKWFHMYRANIMFSNKFLTFLAHQVFHNLDTNIKKRGFRNVPWLRSAKIQITKNWVGLEIAPLYEKKSTTDYDYLLNFLKF
jgi:hypothetical protein